MWQSIYDFIIGNQVLGGILGGSFMVSVLYALKGIPQRLGAFLLWRFTTELTVFNEDSAFDRLSEWLTTLEYTKRARKLRLTTSYRNDEGEILHTPGIGKHLIWFKRRPVIICRTIPDNQKSSWRRTEDITIRMWGSSPKPMRQLIQEIIDVRKKTSGKTIEVYLYRGSYWKLACRKAKRSMASVILPKNQKKRIIDDLEYFLTARKWYIERGIPYRRGLFLYGPPGCGKTSFVMALAGHFQRPIYALNLGSLQGDEALIEAVTSVPEYGILLIEDIDVAKASHTRDSVPSNPEGEKKDEAKGITLSGLLNSLDGTFSRDGRILVMTTNHPENVDPAILRTGRVDLKECIGKLGPPEVYRMCKQFLRDDDLAMKAFKEIETPIIPADLQEILLKTIQNGWFPKKGSRISPTPKP